MWRWLLHGNQLLVLLMLLLAAHSQALRSFLWTVAGAALRPTSDSVVVLELQLLLLVTMMMLSWSMVVAFGVFEATAAADFVIMF